MAAPSLGALCWALWTTLVQEIAASLFVLRVPCSSLLTQLLSLPNGVTYVSNHPVRAGRPDVVKDRRRTAFVRNVPFRATEEDIVDFFSQVCVWVGLGVPVAVLWVDGSCRALAWALLLAAAAYCELLAPAAVRRRARRGAASQPGW